MLRCAKKVDSAASKRVQMRCLDAGTEEQRGELVRGCDERDSNLSCSRVLSCRAGD